MKEIRKPITDEQVEKEIDKLKQSKAVKLAKQERRVKTKRRQYLYQLHLLAILMELLKIGIKRDIKI